MKFIRCLAASCICKALAMLAQGAGAPPPPHAVPTAAQPTHVFRDGIALIEAESGQGGWERIVDQGTRAIRAVAGAEMQYRVHFPEAGFYFVQFRAHYTAGFKTPAGEVLKASSTNDASVLVGGARLYGSDLTTRPEGMRCHSAEFRWWNLPKGPGGHTPESIKSKPVQTYVPAAGVYDVTIRYRSPALVIDKLAFTRGKEAPADNLTETTAQR